jgi:ATP-binding cassette, subfamily B, multidrug efflux pump
MKILLRLLPYFKKYKKIIFLGIFSTLFSNIFGIIIPLLIRNAINSLKTESNFNNILQISGLILGSAALSGFFLYLTRRTIIVASRDIEYDLRNDFFSHLLRLPIRFYQNTPVGDLMAHATNDINAIRNFIGPAILYSSDTCIAFILIVSIMINMNPMITLYSFLPLPLITVFVYLISRKVHKRFEDVQDQFSVLTAKAQESLSGIRIVKSYVREKYEIESFEKTSRDYLQKNLKLVKIQSLMFPLMLLIIGISLLIVVWVGGKLVIEDKLSLGDMTAFIIYIGYLIWPMMAFGWVANLVQQSSASMKRIAKIMDIQPEIKDSADTDNNFNTIKGSIEFRNVSFSYNENRKNVLENINLDVKSGETLAIIGFTGSGKSSLVNLVDRIFDPTEGEIFIDGTNIKKIPLDVLRNQIGFVTQETFLFSTSIKENIAFGMDNFKEEDILFAADVSQILKDVENFPNKFDTVIGERGITLSGGQKQRVSIARAVMKNPKIIILDDCLSAVDTYTEEEILKRLKKFMEDRTSIIISHRISTVKHADKIIVLDNGKIVESGNHDQLIEFSGIYADLYYKQQLEKEIEEM